MKKYGKVGLEGLEFGSQADRVVVAEKERALSMNWLWIQLPSPITEHSPHSGTPCPRRKALTSAVTFHDIGCIIFISVHALVSGKLKASGEQ